jgi:hypothetical protein
MLFALYKCRWGNIEEKCNVFKAGDHVLIGPYHSLGHIKNIRNDGKLDVIFQTPTAITKTMTVTVDQVHKVVFVNNLPTNIYSYDN